ncbi:unnamed protein product [Wickerhamomyces anomalus]
MDLEHHDFRELAGKYSYLKEFLDDDGHYDFRHPGLCQLTKAILKEDYEIDVDLRSDRLCPTIPSRLEYLKIINHVLKECGIEEPIRGLEVGTGAYAIYSILGYKKYGWTMAGTDIDSESIANAKSVLKSNRLNEVLDVIDVSASPDEFFQDGDYNFTMCSVVASDNELVTIGGEVEFVKKLIEKSGGFPEIDWFSSLLGKKSSIEPLITVLNEIGNKNFFIKDYQLGNTKRWILFWSFRYKRPIIENDYKKIDPTIVRFDIDLGKIEQLLKDLPLNFQRSNDEITVTTNGDVWSRSFRRKKQKPNELDKSIFKIRKPLHLLELWTFNKDISKFPYIH